MKAMVIDRFGPPEVFELRELPDPEPGPGEVRIRVRASSLNPVDTKIRRGDVPVGPEFPAVLHGDVAGVVDALGPGVEGFAEGDAVFGCAGGVRGLPGALAEYMIADARLIAPAPESLSLEEAAALPLVSITAWEALVDKVGVREGMHLLIHGGTGGVGHIGVQLAADAGARVTVTVGNEHKASLARSLGAQEAVIHSQETVDRYVARLTAGQGFDAVFDTVGKQVLVDSITAAGLYGQVVTISGRSTLDIKPAFQKQLTLHTVFMLIPMLNNVRREHHGEILREIAARVDGGRLRPLLDERRFGFTEVAAAHARMEAGEHIGKIVLVNDF